MKRLGSLLLLPLLLGLLPLTAGAAQPEAVIPVDILTEGPADTNEMYMVSLVPETEGCPMPEGAVNGVFRLPVTDKGSLHIPCETMGAFEYTLRQIPGVTPGCSYDSSLYRLRLLVTQGEEETLNVQALIYGQDEKKQDGIRFRNRWASPVDVTITARKTLDGRTPKDALFAFRLLSEDGAVVEEVKNDGRAVTFSPLHFDRAGTYRYFLKEIVGPDREMIYDRSVYTATIEVTRGEDFQAEVTFLRNGKPYAQTPAFANYTDTYNPKTGDGITTAFTVLIFSTAALGILLAFKRKA